MAITFESIGNGELAEMFNLALKAIGANIMDPNMDPDAARGIDVGLVFKPKRGGAIEVGYKVKPKMAGFQKSETTFLIGQDARTGRIEMSEYGNNRAEITALDATPVQSGGFDPSTGEIYEEARKGPIDLRAAANQ